MTHCAIGFAWNREQVKIVELYSQKPLAVEKVDKGPDGGVEIKG